MSSTNAMDTKENIDDSESIASDESLDEITDYDEFEFDHRRAQCVSDMKELEQQFAKLKEQLISERNSLIDQKLEEIEAETAEEFVVPLKKLEMNMDFKIKLTTLMRDYRWKNIEHIYECEKESSKLTLKNDMQSLLDKYKQNIENEIRQLEENRRQFLVDYELHQLYLQSEQQTEEQHQHSIDQENHLLSEMNGNEEMTEDMSVPTSAYSCYDNNYIVYTIPDQELLEDLSIIKMHNELSRCAVSTEC